MPSENLFREDQVFFRRSREIKDENTTSSFPKFTQEWKWIYMQKASSESAQSPTGKPCRADPKQGRCPNGSLYRIIFLRLNGHLWNTPQSLQDDFTHTSENF